MSEKGHKGLIVIPYVEGLSEATKRTSCKHRISSAMKSYKILRHKGQTLGRTDR